MVKDAQDSKLLIGWYCAQLFIRVVIFIACTFSFVFAPEQLDISTFPDFDTSSFSNFIASIKLYHVVMAFLLLDMITKVLPRSGISLGARKQFRRYHVPTAKTFEGGAAELAHFVTTIIKDGTLTHASSYRLAMHHAVEKTRSELLNAYRGLQKVKDNAVVAMHTIAKGKKGLQGIKYGNKNLRASSSLRNKLRTEHVKQVLPVAIIWVVFNALVGLILQATGLLIPSVCLLWCVIYFLSDMICVVAWCPFQVLFMKNRCCVTCHIFNWDAIMTVTPLFFYPCLLSYILIVFSAVIFLAWEISFTLYPERFDERTNTSLLCVSCDEQLCKWRGKCSVNSKKM